MSISLKHLDEGRRSEIAAGLFEVTARDTDKGELHGLCPIHGEKNPSFSYNAKKDRYNCFSCGASGDLIKLWCEVKGYGQKEGFKEFCREHGIETGSGPPSGKKTEDPPASDLEEDFAKMAPLPTAWIRRLTEKYGWSEKIIQKLDLRLQTHYRTKDGSQLVKLKKPERVAIPIRDQAGKLKNIRLYKPNARQMKIVSWGKGYGKCRLFPAAPLEDGPVLLCEGEKDTLCALSHGFNAITQTSKRKNWPNEQKAVFKDRDVVIAYDADQAGERYAEWAAHALADHAASIRILVWPDYMGRNENGSRPKDHGQDLTDFFIKHGKTAKDLQELIDAAEQYERPAAAAEVMRFFEVGASGRVSFKPQLLAKRILEDITVMSDHETEQLYKWNGRFWEPYSDLHIEKKCLRYLGKESQKNRVKDACFQVVVSSTLPPDRRINDRTDWVCLKNCMINLQTLETRPHSKDFFCTMSLDVAFDPAKTVKCKRWIRFLKETIQTPEPIDQAQEFAGYCLTRDTRFGKCLLLIGPGSDGKSKFLKILRKLIGSENCSAISFHDLEDQFLRSSLHNRLLNISTEVGSKALESPYFKAITTGDPISAAFKHQNSFSFTPYCKLAFAANKMPRVLDNSDGFFRRVLPISFKRQFLENDPDTDPDLEEALESELSGIFEWAVIGLHRLWKQKRFTQCAETNELLLGYRRLNNPVACFVEDSCAIGDDLDENKDELYKEFRSYCSINGYSPYHKENFFRELAAVVSNLHQYRPRIEGKRERRIKGIALDIKFNE